MPQLDLSSLEKSLQKRWAYPYVWHKKQSNDWDKASNCIYQISEFEELLTTLEKKLSNHPAYKQLFDYALNRWYNFWSAQAVEQIFASFPQVQAVDNAKDRLKDFFLCNIPFDHKTSVFPKHYPYSLAEAQAHPEALIRWLYENQSQQGRKHYANRLFIILYQKDGKHWQLKASLGFLQEKIREYVEKFSSSQLFSLNLLGQSTTYSDIIWAIKE